MELVDFGARWYDPGLGRFISPDTIIPDPTNPQSLNRYSYVVNNPLKFVDRDGHCHGLAGTAFNVCAQVALAVAPAVHKANEYREDIFFPDANTTTWDRVEASTVVGVGATAIAAGAVELVAGTLTTAATTGGVGTVGGTGGAVGTAACRDGDCTNELGQLRSVGQRVWESTAGLRYGADPNFDNRVQHIMNHTMDIANRKIHGVFNSRTNALGIVDEAWQKIQQEGINGIPQGARTIYTVDMGRTIGYVGGKAGAATGYPEASHLQLVIERANEVITAFPVIP